MRTPRFWFDGKKIASGKYNNEFGRQIMNRSPRVGSAERYSRYAYIEAEPGGPEQSDILEIQLDHVEDIAIGFTGDIVVDPGRGHDLVVFHIQTAVR